MLKGQLPYVDSNRFSQENLDKLAEEQPAILAELLFAYPENMAFVDTKYMVERVFSDKGFKLFFNDYLSYLKSYTQEPACIDNMRQYYQNHLKIVLKNKRPSVVMNVLAAGCNDYVARKLEKESLERFLEYAFWSRSLPNGQNQSARSPYAVYAAKVEQ